MSKTTRTAGLAVLIAVLGLGVLLWSSGVFSAEEGVIYYLLTEDNEITLRYPQRMGGDILTRPVFETLMIDKVDRINEIAERHGAIWTHFTTVGPWDIAAYAEQLSDEWSGLHDALIDQVRRGAAAGHEYAPHPHAHWDPRTSLNTAVWDADRNGFIDSWEDYYSWTVGFGRLGDYDELESAVGYLYDNKRRLMEITGVETVVQRSGGWQFGDTPELMAMSIAALRMNGILGNSDADANLTQRGNAGRHYPSALYFTLPDNINEREVSGIHYGTLEFTPTPQPIILYDSNTLHELNAKVDAGVRAFTDRLGRIKPGVHFIVGFTHAKNMMGDGNWSSITGGDFDILDQHLAYVAQKYVQVEKPVIRFATASEAVIHYYDYYSKRPVAVRLDEERQVGDLAYEYPVRVLGQFGPEFTEAAVQPPIWWDARTDIARVEIVEDGHVVASFSSFDSAYPHLPFPVRPRAHANSKDDAGAWVMRVTLLGD